MLLLKFRMSMLSCIMNQPSKVHKEALLEQATIILLEEVQ